jgi:hypothetical protein
MRASSCSPKARYELAIIHVGPFDRNNIAHAYLPRGVGVVRALVAVRQEIDMLVGALLGDPHDRPTHLDIAPRLRWIDNQQRQVTLSGRDD